MNLSARKLIFIVDDDPDDRQFILDALLENSSCIDHLFINSAEQLLTTLSSSSVHYPDLILLDLNMYGVRGIQALKEIRSNSLLNHIPVIILTTSTLENDKKLCYDYGANCFITKSHSYKKMIAVANAILTLWLE